MLIDCLQWFGLAILGVVFILMVCRLIMDFPGLLEGNFLQVLKESKDVKKEPFDEVLVDKRDRSARAAGSDDEERVSPKHSGQQAVPRSVVIQVTGGDDQVEIVIKQHSDFSIHIDIAPGDTLAENDKPVSHTDANVTKMSVVSTEIATEAGDGDGVSENRDSNKDPDKAPAECVLYKTKDVPERQN